MTTPLRNCPILLFVDNYYSKPDCWRSLELRLEQDNELKEYSENEKVHCNPDLPLDATAGKLAEVIEQKCRGREIVIVGHGLGATVIFKYLIDRLKAGILNPGVQIQQIILFGPIIFENRSFTKRLLLLQYLKYFLLSPIDPTLRLMRKRQALAEELKQLNTLMARQVINYKPPTTGNTVKSTIPIVTICGMKDILVDQKSVERMFGKNKVSVPGGHQLLIRARSEEDENWRAFRSALTEPYGHKFTLLINSLTIALNFKSASQLSEIEKQERWGKEYALDHAANVVHTIDFSRRNICLNKYVITHSVQENGHISEKSKSYKDNERAAASLLGNFHRLHTNYHSEFDPDLSRNPYKLTLEVINGFNDAQFYKEGPSQVDPYSTSDFYAPFFIGMGERYYRQITITLDLSSILKDTSKFSDLNLHWLPEEVNYNLKSSELTNLLSLNEHKINYTKTETGSGQWQFNLHNIRYGTFILTWKMASLYFEV